MKTILVLLALVGASQLALGSAIKGYEQQQTKGSPLAAPAAKGRPSVERKPTTLEHVNEAPKQEQLKQEQLKQEQLKQEELVQVQEAPTKTIRREQPARKEPARQEELKQELEQQKPLAPAKGEPPKQAEEQRQEPIQEKGEELASKTRYEARPQLVEQQEQLKQDFADKQEIELREEQRKVPAEPFQVQVQRIEQQPIVQTKFEQQQQEEFRGEAEPYSFSYNVDGSSRSESGDTRGVVRGQYTVQGADGSRRIVDYIADQDGFRASINTNEFGTEPQSPAGVALRSSQPSAEEISLRYEGKAHSTQQQQQYERVESAAVKGAAAQPSAVKSHQEQEPITQLLAVKETRREPERSLEESNKSAELLLQSSEQRKSKALKTSSASSYLEAQRAKQFESATAHRDYRQPAKAVRNYQQQQPQPARQLTREYNYGAEQSPPSPVQVHTRRYPSSASVASAPRLYSASAAASSEDEAQPLSGFDSRSS